MAGGTAVGVLAEAAPGERRVALTPDVIGRLTALGLCVLVQCGAGEPALFADADYRSAGAQVVSRKDLLDSADLLLAVRAPAPDDLRPGQGLLGMLGPLADPQLMACYAQRGVLALSLDQVPRTLSRAQAMDPVTSQANVAGYKAVLVAADAYAGYFPMLMTAAGTIRPAEVLVLGAGVAGLQAIGTARRLGAVVRGYDVRPESKAEIESVGGRFLETGGPSASGLDGHARALTEQEAESQRLALAVAVVRHDVVITTALVPGCRPPLLVTAQALADMRPGSVVVDLAAGPRGGNVAGSQPDRTLVTAGGVVVIGAPDLAATVPRAASSAYARNLAAALASLCPAGRLEPDPSDQVHAAIVITRDGQVVHAATAALLREHQEAGREPSPVH